MIDRHLTLVLRWDEMGWVGMRRESSAVQCGAAQCGAVVFSSFFALHGERGKGKGKGGVSF